MCPIHRLFLEVRLVWTRPASLEMNVCLYTTQRNAFSLRIFYSGYPALSNGKCTSITFFWFPTQIFPTRYLRCPSAVTVNVLKKFLVVKFAIPNTHQVISFFMLTSFLPEDMCRNAMARYKTLEITQPYTSKWKYHYGKQTVALCGCFSRFLALNF